MSDPRLLRMILRERLPDLIGDLYIWLPTAAGPQLGELTDIMGTIDLHLFVKSDPEGRMYLHVKPPPAPNDALDAARYRYLRDSPHFNRDMGRLEWYLPRWYTGHWTKAERLDQSIDEAMKERR
jgi:hypothetical protein